MEFFDDKETRANEEKMQEYFRKVEEFRDNGGMEHMIKLIHPLMKIIEELKSKKENDTLTKEESDLFSMTMHAIKDLAIKLDDIMLILGEKLMRQSYVIMEAYKTEADKGNPEAKAAYERLHDSYLKTLPPKENN